MDSQFLFLAKLTSFGMERQFVKRDTRNQKLIAGGALSPVVLDYIMDSEAPRPCRHFVGREEELGELHTMPEDSEEERFRKHNRLIRSLKDDTLLIIDNFNVTATQDSFLSVMLKYRCRILFTTRSKFDGHLWKRS